MERSMLSRRTLPRDSEIGQIIQATFRLIGEAIVPTTPPRAPRLKTDEPLEVFDHSIPEIGTLDRAAHKYSLACFASLLRGGYLSPLHAESKDSLPCSVSISGCT